MSVYSLIVLRSLLVFDALLLLVVGVLLAWFMAAPAGILFGAGCRLTSGMLFGGGRWADRLYDRGGDRRDRSARGLVVGAGRHVSGDTGIARATRGPGSRSRCG